MRTTALSSMGNQPRSPTRTASWSSARNTKRGTGTAVPVSSLVNPLGQPKIKEHGLQYYQHWRGIYPYPCDDRDAERLDVLHSLIYETALSGALHMAHLSPPTGTNERLRVLDLGCGSARWAQDMANVNPYADVYGIDIGDVDERLEPGVANNFYFRSGVDFESPDWDADYESGYFHFIHIAQLQGAVSDWPLLLRKAHRLLAPGGQLELIDIDWSPHTPAGRPPPDSPYRTWWNAMQYASSMRNKPLAFDADVMGQNLWASGFDILLHRTERLDPAETPPEKRCPTITDGNTIAPDFQDDESAKKQRMLAGWTRLLLGTPQLGFFDAPAMALLTALPNWTPAHVNALADQAGREISKFGCPIYFFLHMWTVRKRGN